MGRGGGGLQLPVSCALITMISQCTMLHIQKVTLLDSILFFGMQMNAECCLHLQDQGHCTEPHKLTNNESCGSQTCSAFTIFHCWYVLLSVFSWCFCNIGMWQAGNASGISIWEPVSNVFFSCSFWVKTTGRANEEQRAPSQTVRDGIKAPWCFELTCVFSYWGSVKCCFGCGQWVTIVVV